MVLCHFVIKFILAGAFRQIYSMHTGLERVTLGKIYSSLTVLELVLIRVGNLQFYMEEDQKAASAQL